jgi:DNA repair protein RecO (recombination protein O)
MEYIKVKGIVCRIVEYKESDKILSVLTFEKGKISIVAKGVKKRGAIFAHAARLFYCGEFECVISQGMPVLTGASMLQDFFDITNDIETLYYASHFMDVASCFIQEDQEAQEQMSLLLNSLYLLMKHDSSYKLLTAILEFRFAALEGAAPVTDVCVDCKNELTEDKPIYFSMTGDGVSCCKEGIPISRSVLFAIEHICNGEGNSIYFFKISKQDIDVLYGLSRQYIEKIAQKHFSILDHLSGI